MTTTPTTPDGLTAADREAADATEKLEVARTRFDLAKAEYVEAREQYMAARDTLRDLTRPALRRAEATR